MNLEEEISRLIADLAHPGLQVSQAAAYSLIDIGQPAIPALIDTLRSHQQEKARSLAAYVLGRLQAPEAVPALVEALELEAHDQPVLVITHQAYESLLEIGTPEALRAAEAYSRKVRTFYDGSS